MKIESKKVGVGITGQITIIISTENLVSAIFLKTLSGSGVFRALHLVQALTELEDHLTMLLQSTNYSTIPLQKQISSVQNTIHHIVASLGKLDDSLQAHMVPPFHYRVSELRSLQHPSLTITIYTQFQLTTRRISN